MAGNPLTEVGPLLGTYWGRVTSHLPGYKLWFHGLPMQEINLLKPEEPADEDRRGKKTQDLDQIRSIR